MLLLSTLCVLQAVAAAPAPEPGHVVQIQCLDERGLPLAGVGAVWGLRRSLTTARALDAPMARGDAEGVVRFRVADASEPRRSLLVAAPGHASLLRRVALGVVERVDSDGVRVFDLGAVRLPKGAILRGRVRSVAPSFAGASVEVTDAIHKRVPGQSPRYCSIGRTKADGSFELRAVLREGLRVLVRAPGHYTRILPWVAEAGDGVECTLEESGYVSGRVLGSPTRMRSWSVLLQNSLRHDTAVLPLGKAGRFRVTREVRGKFELSVAGKGVPRFVRSEHLDGPREGLLLDAQMHPGRPLWVFARDGVTKAPLRKFEVQSAWGSLASGLRRGMGRPDSHPVASSNGERAELIRPLGATRGAILVDAPGYAPGLVRDLRGKDELLVDLFRACQIQGRVLGQDGKGVAGITVHARGEGLPRVAHTDKRGRFEFQELWPRRWDLVDVSSEYGVVGTQSVSFAGHDELRVLAFRLGEAHTIYGKLRGWSGARDGRVLIGGSRAPLSLHRLGYGARGFGARVREDGRFTWTHYGEMPARLSLDLPSRPFCVHKERFELGAVIEGAIPDVPHQFELPRPTLRSFSGRVVHSLPALPKKRVLVRATPAPSASFGATASVDFAVGVRWAWVQPDGSFALELPACNWKLGVHDAMTGLELAAIDVRRELFHGAPAQRSGLAIEAALAVLDVEIPSCAAARLLIGDLDSKVHRESHRSQARGDLRRNALDLDGAVPRARLYVPAGATTLTATEALHFSDNRILRRSIGRVLFGAEVDAEAGKTRKIVLQAR